MKLAKLLVIASLMALNIQCAVAGDDVAANAAIDVIMTRTSVRSWTDQPVEQAKIETMLKAAMAAPTAVNRQPWHFVVVQSREGLDALADSSPRGGGMLRKAQLAIVVCGDMNLALDGDGRDFWVQDASAATENLLLAAHALGLGAVWTGGYPIAERVNSIRQALDLPDNLVPLATVLIGYPAESPAPKQKWNPDKVSYK